MQMTGPVAAERPRFVFVARRLDPGRLYELIMQARLGTLGLWDWRRSRYRLEGECYVIAYVGTLEGVLVTCDLVLCVVS